MSKYNLAQINIARMLAPIEGPVMVDFVNNLDRINALAEKRKGFKWRLKGEENNATTIWYRGMFRRTMPQLLKRQMKDLHTLIGMEPLPMLSPLKDDFTTQDMLVYKPIKDI